MALSELPFWGLKSENKQILWGEKKPQQKTQAFLPEESGNRTWGNHSYQEMGTQSWTGEREPQILLINSAKISS